MDRFFSAMSTLTENADEGELSLFNEMPCYISLHSPDLEIMDTNQLFEKTFGNLLREPSWAIYAQRGNGDTDCPVKRTFQAETGQRSRELIRTRRGQLAPVEVHTLPFPGGENCEDMVLELCVNLSRMEELRNTLAETQHHYQQLFDEVPCYISVLDEDLRVRAANKRFKEDFGDPAGGCCYRVFKQREAPCTDCPALMTFEDGLPRQSESAVQTRDGAMRNVLISTTPLKDAQGGVAQVMEVSTDITRIRELQDHLTSLGLLLGSVSHEMKNLLTLTDGGSYKVEAGLARGDLERIQQGWQTVTHTLGRIKKMVLDILLYAKKPEIEKAPVKASELAEDAVGQVRPRLDEHGLCLDLSLADPSWEVLVDRDTIHSALTNILENAVDACLSAPRTDRPSIALSVRACDQGQTIFEIADNGVGLDPECRNNLFTLFYTSKGRKGTGLGLFVAKHIVDQHGGSIEVDSSPGQGSVFRVALP
jgi:signal transduction histidine kinase